VSDFAAMTPDQQVPALTELARAAGDRWGFGPATTYDLFKHRENAVFSVVESGERFAMRIHRPGYHTDAELESELAWIAALLDDGFPTPRVVPTVDGHTMARAAVPSVPEERQVDLLEWFDGAPLGAAETEALTDPEDVAATFRSIGELMATAHNHAESWQRPASFTRHAWDADGLLGDEPFWGPYVELEILTADQLALLARMKARALADLTDFGQGPDRYGLIHADFVPDNLLRGDDGLCVIDFDDAGFGWHLFDIATSLFPSLLDDWFDDAQDAMIEGYRRRRALPDDHLERLPLFYALRGTTYLGWAHTRRETETAEIIGALVAAGMDELITDYLGSD
jgi:Ser/Thr protein kinase RdoA (MazF antagonist)